MKFAIALSILVLAGRAANAAGLNEGQFTRTVEVIFSTRTCDGVSIASQPATEVMRSSSSFYTGLSVENLDLTSQIFCSDSVSVSTQTGSNLVGEKIGTTKLGTGKISLALPAGQLWYCMNDGVTTTVRAVICRWK